VLVLRVLDPAETAFPFRNAVMFRDMESRRDVYVDPGEARQQYQRRFQQHDQQIKSICDDLGVDYAHAVTDRPLERALFDLLRAQLHRGRGRVTHRTGGSRRVRGGGA
jgi:uncharacterized protein (DUF58 family)